MPVFTKENNPMKPKKIDTRIVSQVARGDPVVIQPEIDAVKRMAIETVKTHMPTVNRVLAGKETWSQSQVRLFGMMLNKAVPDVKETKHSGTIDHAHRRADEMTQDELLEIAAQGRAELTAASDTGASPIPKGTTLEGVAKHLVPQPSQTKG